jgi:uncharacterized phosphosugar-binding protein
MPADTSIRHQYRDLIVAGLDRVLAEQEQALSDVCSMIVNALASDHIIFVAGSGHSHMLAEEVFYRAGGIAAAQAILDPALMLHVSASRATELEQEAGRARVVLDRYQINPGDVAIIASHSGRNAYPIELAVLAKERGAQTVALTSLAHSRQTTSRHASGQRLFDVTDYVLDNGVPYGDCALPIPGHASWMGPLSTIMGAFILNSLMAEAVAELTARGVSVDVYQSANRQGAEASADAQALVERWRGRIVGL